MGNGQYGISVTKCDICCPSGQPGQRITVAGKFYIGLEARATAGFDERYDWQGFQVYVWGGVQLGGAAGIEGAISAFGTTCQSGINGLDVCAEGSLALFGRIGGDLRAQWKYWSWNVGLSGGVTVGLPVKSCLHCDRDGNCRFTGLEWGKPGGTAWIEGCFGPCFRKEWNVF
jgi:hypothetical protein